MFLADDEPAVRRGLRFLLNLEANLMVCGEAESEHGALEGILKLRPDLAVVDLSFKEGDGLALIKRLHHLCPALRILVFSMHDQLDFAIAAFAAGAHGYVIKEEGAERVVQAIQAVMAGGYYLSQPVAAKAPHHRPLTGPCYRTQPL